MLVSLSIIRTEPMSAMEQFLERQLLAVMDSCS